MALPLTAPLHPLFLVFHEKIREIVTKFSKIKNQSIFNLIVLFYNAACRLGAVPIPMFLKARCAIPTPNWIRAREMNSVTSRK